MTVRDVVERERAVVRRRELVAGIAGALAATLLLLTASVALLGGARWLSLPRALPFGVWILAIAINGVAVWRVRRRAAAATAARIAAEIEREQHLREGVVRGALEVADSGALGRRAAAAVADDLRARGAVLAPALLRREQRRATIAIGAASAATIAALAITPAFTDGLRAILRPASAYAGTLVPRLALRDAPAAVLRGAPLRLTVSAPGRSLVTLRYRAAGSAWDSVRVAVRDGLATADLGEMRGAVQVLATDGRSSSDTARIDVADRPFIGSVTLRAIFPGYLGRPAETLPLGGRVQVPRGTVLGIEGQASVALSRVALATERDTVPLHAHAHAFSGRVLADASGTWQWLADAEGGAFTVDVPEPLVLDVLADSAPVVDLMAPANDTAIAPGQTLALRVGAADDHALASVVLETQVERAGGAAAVRRRTIATNPGALWEGSAAVQPLAAGAEAGDVIQVRVVAVDASPWRQAGASRVLRVRILTSEERRDRARDLADSAVAAAQSTAQAQRALARKTEEAARARDAAGATGTQRGATPQQAMSHEAGERARTIAQEQRQLVEKVEQLRDAARELEEGLRHAGAMDSALARQLRDAQDLMRQALTPELMEQMQRLEQAAQQLSGDAAREALRDLAQMQQRLREQLEQSAEMLKRAAHEGAMQTLSDEARELAQREQALADSAAQGKTDGRQQAQALAERSERYAEDVRALQERLERDRANAAREGTTEARQAARRAEEHLRDAAGQPKAQEAPSAAQRPAGQRQGGEPRSGGQRQSAGQQPQAGQQAGQQTAAEQRQVAQGARDASAQMEQAANAMQAARDAQVKEWKQELTQELDRAVQEMLQMAREERAMEQQARDGQAGPEQLRGRQSSVQQGVEQTRQRLQEAGRRSSLLSGGAQRAMADAREKVQAATRELSRGAGQGNSPQQSAEALAEAAESLNRAAAAVARDRERAGTAGSASGFAEMMQQLQEMAKRQGSINSQAQSILQMPGGQQSAQAAQMARSLARQQRQVAQGLDDVSEEAGGSRAAELASEARQLAEALEAGRLDARTAARQEQLFKRLLDAGRSLEKEEREDSDRREARAATGAEVHTPAGGTASGRDARRFREPTWDELRGLSAEERRAIVEYFRRINAAPEP